MEQVVKTLLDVVQVDARPDYTLLAVPLVGFDAHLKIDLREHVVFARLENEYSGDVWQNFRRTAPWPISALLTKLSFRYAVPQIALKGLFFRLMPPAFAHGACTLFSVVNYIPQYGTYKTPDKQSLQAKNAGDAPKANSTDKNASKAAIGTIASWCRWVGRSHFILHKYLKILSILTRF